MTKQIPQGYKKTKVGIIPEDWEVVKLSKIVQHTVRDTKKPDVGYWRLGLRSHGKGTFHEYIEDPKKIAMETLYKVNENDLIINITFAWEHAIAIANKNDHGKLVSHRFPTYQFINNNNHLFYKYYVLQEKFRLMLENISPGGAGRNRVMSKKSFLELIIIRPSREEQDEIVKILSTWDNAIDKQDQLIKQKQEFKKGIMQQIFSQKLSFKDDNCNAYETWEYLELSELVTYEQPTKYIVSSTDYCDDYPTPVLTAGKSFILGYTNETNGIFKENLPVIIFDDFTTSNKFVNFEFKVKSSAIKILLPVNNKINIKYIYERMQFIDFALGDEHKRYWISEYSQEVIEVPNFKEQTKIADFLTSLDNEIANKIEILTQLKLQKQSLMQKLLTGQIRVFNSDKEIA